MRNILVLLFGGRSSKKDTPIVVSKESAIESLKNIFNYLKNFKRSDFEGHSVVENHTPALGEFKCKYREFLNIMRVSSVTPEEIGISRNDIQEFGLISLL